MQARQREQAQVTEVKEMLQTEVGPAVTHRGTRGRPPWADQHHAQGHKGGVVCGKCIN